MNGGVIGKLIREYFSLRLANSLESLWGKKFLALEWLKLGEFWGTWGRREACLKFGPVVGILSTLLYGISSSANYLGDSENLKSLSSLIIGKMGYFWVLPKSCWRALFFFPPSQTFLGAQKGWGISWLLLFCWKHRTLKILYCHYQLELCWQVWQISQVGELCAQSGPRNGWLSFLLPLIGAEGCCESMPETHFDSRSGVSSPSSNASATENYRSGLSILSSALHTWSHCRVPFRRAGCLNVLIFSLNSS